MIAPFLAAAALVVANPVPHVAPGALLGRIQIPALHLVMPIREGTAQSVLDRGVGHYRGHRFKFAGHDVTPVLGRPYGPFHNIMSLKKGYVIIVTMQGRRHVFRVTGHRVVRPTEVSLLRVHKLILTTCWPRHTALRRWVVFAKEIS